MRKRYLKPGFFENETLSALPPTARLLFAGLWLMADKKGRLRDRPARIKGELFPYDNTNVVKHLKQLADDGFIKRYEAEGQALIWIPSWAANQNPHPHEPESTLPRHPDDHGSDDVITLEPGTGTGNSDGNSDENENEGEDGDRDEQAPAPTARPPSGADAQLPQWDFVRALFLQNFRKEPSFADRQKLKSYMAAAPTEWLLAAMNQSCGAKEPGMGYVIRVMDDCIANDTPPSSLKKRAVAAR